MKAFIVVASLVGLLGLSSASAVASSIQLPVWAGNGTDVGAAFNSQTASQTGLVTFDNFSFTSTTTINEVTWWGIYLDASFKNAAPNTTRWDTLIFSDVAGLPQTLLGGAIDNTTVKTTAVGSGIFRGNTVTVFQFVAQLPDFTAVGGTEYYFSPVSVGPGIDPAFAWIQGTGGDAASLQVHITNTVPDSFFTPTNDRAFVLATVPEPATLALVGFGLVIAGLTRRRR